MLDLRELGASTLSDLVGCAADPLPLRIYEAQCLVDHLRHEKTLTQQELGDARNHRLAQLYETGCVGKNERERGINEAQALADCEEVQELELQLERRNYELVQAEASLQLAQDNFAAVRTKASLLAAILQYCAATSSALPQTHSDGFAEDTADLENMPFILADS
jgi:hypothetical protein